MPLRFYIAFLGFLCGKIWTLNTTRNEAQPSGYSYSMGVKLMSGYVIYDSLLNVLDITQPYDLHNDCDLGNANKLILRYWFADELQLREVKTACVLQLGQLITR